MTSVLAVIVSYAPGPSLEALCAALATEECDVLVIDNDSASGLDVLERCRDVGAEVMRLTANVGVGGALALGLERARGFDWLLTFDQDSQISQGFVSALVESTAASDSQVALIGPVVVDAESGAVLQGGHGDPAPLVITSGCLCRVSAVEDVGGFRAELFIDFVDYDLCLRLRQKGWSLALEPSVTMRHTIGAMRDHAVMGLGSVRNSHHSADRHYYKYRNFMLLCSAGTARVDPGWTLRTGLALVWGPLKVIAFEDNKVAKINASATGVRDGVFGRSGPRRAPQRDPGRELSREQAPGGARHDPGQPRVLFIGSHFFGYHQHIAAALEARGYAVDYYSDRPSENPFIKGAIRLRPSMVNGVVDKYLESILSETKGTRYDLIFVLKGEALTPSFLREIRRRNPDAEAVLYLWDALRLYPHVKEIAGLFDRRYTFDRLDACSDPGFSLLPLFFSHDYRAVPDAPPGGHYDYDIVNLCTAHANRYALMRSLLPALRSAGLTVFSYLYLNPVQLAYNKVRSKTFARARLREFKFRPMAATDYIEVLTRSRAALDVSHAAQSGLTMRTIETIGARRKVITTNADVVHYPIYHPSRVLLLDPEHIDATAIRSFIEEASVPMDPESLERYSVDSWVRTIVTGGEAGHDSILTK